VRNCKMSTQRGNVARSRAQRYQNKTSFKNNLYDTSKKTKDINGLKISAVCEKCKNIIDWKIKYKKYKPLTVPRKCNICGEKSVKKAYHTICDGCVVSTNVCGKCGESTNAEQLEILPSPSEAAKQQSLIDQEVDQLPERKRRTLLRHLKKEGNATGKEGISIRRVQQSVSKSKDGDYLEGLDNDLDSLDITDNELSDSD